MFVGEASAAVTRLCRNTVWTCVCPDLVHDFKGFAVGEDVNKTKEETVLLANTIGFNKAELHDNGDLLSHIDELLTEDLSELETEGREELWSRVWQSLKFCVHVRPQAKNCPKHCDSLIQVYQFLTKTIQTQKFKSEKR